ncbi:MAG: right-handed parallel beta-helix repeat-containing protein, partial [Candidatus Kariarchaeaceae archaeon]
MILPLAISPATGSVTSIMEPQEIPSAIVEMVAPGYEKSDAPYLAEWRNTRDSFEIPDIDLSLEKPEITIGDANDYLLTIEDLETDSVDLDGKPCSTCLKESRGIIIDEAKDLRRLNGKGTIDDPYVITGLAFIDDRKNALQIQDVGGYFLITGNEFRGSESGLFSDLILSNIAGSVSITGNNFTGVNSIGIMSSNVGAVEMYGNNVFGYNGESVTISGSSNVVISGNSIYNNAYGVVVDSSTSGSIDNNNIYSNTGNGITLSFSSNFAIDSNTIFNNGGDGIFLQDSNANTISNNNVYSNGPGAATLELESTRMVTYSGGSFNLEGFFGSGIYLDPSFDNDITGNIVENNAAFGVFLEFSDRTTIDTNTISGNDLSGIFFLDTDASAVINNIIANNGQGGTSLAPNMNLSPMESRMLAGFFGSGIYLDPSFNNEINGNTITNSGGDGLFLEFSDSNTINGNTITDNGFTGISFLDSDDNVISANQIAGNGASGASLLMNANLSPFE